MSVLDKQEIKPESLPEDFTGNIISWENYLKNIWDFDVIFKTPGISPFHSELIEHRAKFTSQTELFFSHYRGKVIGITGTKW